MINYRIRCSLFHDIPVVHNQHPVTELLHQRNVMADEQDRELRTLLAAKRMQQFQNFFLHCHIQCGGCFVANQHLRLYSKGAGNRCALALSAADPL